MMAWLAVAAGGALGAVARYASVRLLLAWAGPGFPWGTLLVNVVGSGLAGWLWIRLAGSSDGDVATLRALLIVGFFGAYTTFSAFSVETLRLLHEGQAALAAANVIGTVLLCLLAAAGGMALGRLAAA